MFLPTLNEMMTTKRLSELEAKRTASEKYGAPLVDPTVDLRPQGKDLYLDADPVHYNARGNAIVAERLFEALTNSIGR
jgi:lysophospholipase L1-like esterase